MRFWYRKFRVPVYLWIYGSVYCYGLNNTHMFSEKEIEQILKAIRADIEDGNLAKYYQYCEQPEDTYYSNIELEYYSTGRYVDNWMYYYDYHNSLEKLEGKAVDGQEMTVGGSVSDVRSDCVYRRDA